jgi:hypothetical protein
VVDNFSGYLAGFPLVEKDDTTDVLISLLKKEKKKLGYFPTMICSDGGGEFIRTRLVCYLDKANFRTISSRTQRQGGTSQLHHC